MKGRWLARGGPPVPVRDKSRRYEHPRLLDGTHRFWNLGVVTASRENLPGDSAWGLKEQLGIPSQVCSPPLAESPLGPFVDEEACWRSHFFHASRERGGGGQSESRGSPCCTHSGRTWKLDVDLFQLRSCGRSHTSSASWRSEEREYQPPTFLRREKEHIHRNETTNT